MTKRSTIITVTLGIIAVCIIASVTIYLHVRVRKAAPINYTRAPDFIGQSQTFYGRVVTTSFKKGTDFIDFCSDYTRCPLSLVVLYRNTSKFGDISRYSGHMVIVTGTVTKYSNRTEIILTDPNQIKLND